MLFRNTRTVHRRSQGCIHAKVQSVRSRQPQTPPSATASLSRRSISMIHGARGYTTIVALLCLVLFAHLGGSIVHLHPRTAMPRRSATSSIGNESATATTTALPEKTAWPSTFTDGLPLPKLVVFDLDYTLWPFWVDTHVTPPIKAQEGGLKVKDRYGEGYGFYPDIGGILDAVRHLFRAVASNQMLIGPS